MYKINEFDSKLALDEQFSTQVAKILAEAIEVNGKASIAVSGGNTPKGFFAALSKADIAWEKVTITLADERWVEQTSDASNTQLVKQNLLQNNAAKATFFELKVDGDLTQPTLLALSAAAEAQILPFDVLVLGMGEDGHTASLFPCCNELAEALDTSNKQVLLKTVPTSAPHQRITFSYAALLESKQIFLHISGEGKKTVLQQAIEGTDVSEMPIRGFLHHSTVNTTVYWAK